MLVVALTGGIGSGKTTAAARLTELGVPVIDADVIAHELTAAGEPALEAIGQLFGPKVFLADGSLDRTALRRLVFRDPSERKRLESILHPRIRARMLERLAALDAPYAVLVIPLLFEANQMDLADRILVIDLPEEEQVRRVSKRSNLTQDEIERILASQVGRRVRLEGADDVISNSGDRAALFAQLDQLHRRYLTLAAKRQI